MNFVQFIIVEVSGGKAVNGQRFSGATKSKCLIVIAVQHGDE